MKLHELFYLLGRGSLVEARESLRQLGKHADIAVYIDRPDSALQRELLRWKRRMLLASLRGKRPEEIEPPATLRPVMLQAYLASTRKLVLSDSQISEVEESGEEEG